MCKISVIVPVYNVELLLSKCVNSILAQSYRNFELILIDDGSSDKSGLICDDFAQKDNRVKVVHKKNEGVSSARNEGVQLACGDWITFIDSDDWIDEDYLLNFDVDNIECDSSIVLQGIVQNFSHRQNEVALFEYDNSTFDIKNLERLKAVDLFKDGCPVAKLFNKKTILENGLTFNTSISLNEDHIFVLSYYTCIKNIYLKKYTGYHYYYDFSKTSLTKKRHSVEKCLLTSKLIQSQFLELCKEIGCLPQDIAKIETLNIFGRKQIVRGVKNSFFEKESFPKFKKCYNAWKKNVLGKDRGKFERMLSFFFSKGCVKIAYLMSITMCHIENFSYKMKCCLKKLVWNLL